MRAAMPLAAVLLVSLSLTGCMGIDNMAQFKAALGFAPEPLKVLEPVARIRASPTLASTGQPVAFSAQGSYDPQSLPLTFRWDFGDGARAAGSEATHAFHAGGFFTVTLDATNAAGAAGSDTLLLTVADNRPPSVTLAVLKDGKPVQRALAGDELAFAAQASDPEAQPLELRWDFGDGSTALAGEARHAYARGGRYAVALRAEDPQGMVGTAQQALAIDTLATDSGQVALLGAGERATPLDIAAAAQALHAAVTFDANLGLNALEARLVDPAGNVVAAQKSSPAPGTQGPVRLALDLDASALAGHAPGAWRIVVARASGISIDYDLTAAVHY